MEASKELKLIVESNRIPNALIFQGIYGSGKLRAAVEFTKEINLSLSSLAICIERERLESILPLTSLPFVVLDL